MTSVGAPLTTKCRWIPFSGMESGPSVRCVFAGTGISDGRSVLLLVVVVACDTDAVTVLEAVALVDVAVLELGELLQAVATKPIAAVATRILCVISPT
jgi:hypothetical protein